MTQVTPSAATALPGAEWQQTVRPGTWEITCLNHCLNHCLNRGASWGIRMGVVSSCFQCWVWH